MAYFKSTSLALLFLAVATSGCGNSTPLPPVSDLATFADLAMYPFDAGNSSVDLATNTVDASTTPDLVQGPTCGPSGPCQNGHACGDACCLAGESCDVSGVMPVCKCGAGPACAGDEICASGVLMQNGCGIICCGGSSGKPCPG